MAADEIEDRDWCGNKTKHLPIVYLAGEGHYGLRARVAGWMQKFGVNKIKFWMSRTGTDLNTNEGLLKVIENVRALPERPGVICIDTLHRHLLGDENSAQDAKSMLDACALLMKEFDCTVILVHHTGVSEEAQHRARGSSAWRGALDIEISVKPSKGSSPIEVVQRKMKDAEMKDSLFFELRKVDIAGWRDEDGEQVSTVVLESVSEPMKMDKKVSKVEENRRRFERAWHSCHRDRDDKGRPFVDRYSMLSFLTGPSIGMKDSYAKRQMQPTANTFIGILLDAEYIEPYKNGWAATSDSAIMDFGDDDGGIIDYDG
jgi:hypothetical protein